MSNELVMVERYLDATPRTGAVAEAVGPFTLFRSTTPWSYYARPRLGGAGTMTPDDVMALARRCKELGLPMNVEWVADTTPSLESAALAAGLAVRRHPLLILTPSRFRHATLVPGVEVRRIGADEPALKAARAVAEVGFGNDGTAVGAAGTKERDRAAAVLPREMLTHLRRRASAGLTVTVVAEDGSDGVVASGSHQPVGQSSEIVGVATLPAWRRRGLAAAVTAELARDAFDGGATLVLLSANDDDVARIYETVGFQRAGTSCVAEPKA